MRNLALAAVLAASSALMPLAHAAPPRPLYQDPAAPIDARVEDLLARMTLEEKVAQMTAVWESKKLMFDGSNNFDPVAAAKAFPNGIGNVSRPNDISGPGSPRLERARDVRGTINLVNAVQRYQLERTRLGIPALFHEEGLHGYAALGATSFPQAIALASSWDPDLVRRVNEVTAREIAARGVSIALTPVVDVARDPRWGRIEETFGEDPYLTGEMGVAAVEGLQGTGKVRTLAPGKVFATLKHMTGHGQPESGTNVGPAPLGERTLREMFFPPFETVVKRTGISAVMPSYNEVDGVPSSANRWMLHDVLRGEMGFDGVLLSDYYAINDLEKLHHVAASMPEAAEMALNAGIDVDLPNGDAYKTLLDGVKAGKVPVARIDQAVRRILSMKFRAGLFEHPYADAAKAVTLTNNADARALALTAAQRSMVLLKNDGILPLALPVGSKPKIAVIGPNANVARLGGYYGQPPVTVSILDGLKNRIGNRADLRFAQGVKITENDDWWADEVKLADPAANRQLIAQAVETARSADTIVLCIGDTEQTSREGWAPTHLGDRSSLDLVGQQQELFDALHALGKPIVVVLINGRPASINTIAEQANAILEGWYLGEQGGNAVADVIIGNVNPGGKLPVTIPRSVGQLPSFYNAKPSARRGYLFDTTEPLYPFGYGLSYSNFEVGMPVLSAATITAGHPLGVDVTVRNLSARAGDETVQVYLHQRVASVTRPIKELKAFRRVTLKGGESQVVHFDIGPEAFQMYDTAMKRVIEPGEFEIMAGPDSKRLKTATVTITAP